MPTAWSWWPAIPPAPRASTSFKIDEHPADGTYEGIIHQQRDQHVVRLGDDRRGRDQVGSWTRSSSRPATTPSSTSTRMRAILGHQPPVAEQQRRPAGRHQPRRVLLRQEGSSGGDRAAGHRAAGHRAPGHRAAPAGTEPPATEPPATEPPGPSRPQPPATEPPATEPPATEPPATEPPATEPPATEPPATEPPATEPPDGGVARPRRRPAGSPDRPGRPTSRCRRPTPWGPRRASPPVMAGGRSSWPWPVCWPRPCS